jgi:hypothetical protein
MIGSSGHLADSVSAQHAFCNIELIVTTQRARRRDTFGHRLRARALPSSHAGLIRAPFSFPRSRPGYLEREVAIGGVGADAGRKVHQAKLGSSAKGTDAAARSAGAPQWPAGVSEEDTRLNAVLRMEDPARVAFLKKCRALSGAERTRWLQTDAGDGCHSIRAGRIGR